MIEKFGWQSYPQKHFESRFTKFYEGYWLPKKFGYDTRKVQYSSLILTDQMTREEALEKLNTLLMTKQPFLMSLNMLPQNSEFPLRSCRVIWMHPIRPIKITNHRRVFMPWVPNV